MALTAIDWLSLLKDELRLTFDILFGLAIGVAVIRSGLAAIWNFSSVSLRVPEGVIVENVELFQNLAVFSRRLAERA